MPVVTNWVMPSSLPFTTIIGAMALAFGLAFGIGGQDAARRLLARGETTVGNTATEVSAKQPVNDKVTQVTRL